MKLIDELITPPEGIFLLHVYRRGELIEVFEEHNLIVTLAKQIHARLLGGDVTNRSLGQIGFSTGTSTPAAGDTSLTAGGYYKAFDAITYPATNQVQCAFSLGTSEANGMAISEFGLLTVGSTLYARKIRSAPLNKEIDLTLSGTWTIAF